MNHRLGNILAVAAASGLLAGLAGCGAQAGGSATAPGPDPSGTASAPPGDKDGCAGAPGEKHKCSGDKAMGDKHEEKPADPPK
jgi:hypothetical protein